jgi:hypothetical protein
MIPVIGCASRPADGGRALDRGDGARDAAALLGLVEPIMAFPSPSVRRNLVPAADGIASQHRQPLDSSPGGADRRLDVVALEKVHDAPPAGAGAVLEMAVDGGIRAADDALLDLVNGLVLGVAIGNGIFGALLEVDDERHRHPRPVRPTRIGPRSPIAQQIAARRSHTTPSFMTSSRTRSLMRRSSPTNS